MGVSVKNLHFAKWAISAKNLLSYSAITFITNRIVKSKHSGTNIQSLIQRSLPALLQ